MKSFPGISRRKFWLKCSSETLLRLRKAFGWIAWILFAVRSKILRFRKFLRCFSLMLVMRFFFKYKQWRCIKLWKASDAILSIRNRKKNQIWAFKVWKSYLPIKFSESRKVFKFLKWLKSSLLMLSISFFDKSSSSSSVCSWRFGKSLNLLCARLITFR